VGRNSRRPLSERQRLLAEDVRRHRLAHRLEVEAGRFDAVAELGEDAVDVLHHLPLLEEVRLLHAERLAHQLEEIDDAERVVPLMGAQLAMTGVVDPDQAVDARRGRRLELAGVQLTLVRGDGRQ